jgi:hypothetical protein
MLAFSVLMVTRRSIITATCEATMIAMKAEATIVQSRRVRIETQTNTARVTMSIASTP